MAIPPRGGLDWDDEADGNYLILDASVYAAREDRNMTLSGGGTLLYTASTGEISFTQDLVLHHGVNSYVTTIPVSQSPMVCSVALRLCYAVIPRDPTAPSSLTVVGGKLFYDQVAVPKSNTALLLAIRDSVSPTNKVRLYGGVVLVDGVPGSLGPAVPAFDVPVSMVADGNVAITSRVVYINAASGDVDATLPSAVGRDGMPFIVKRIDSSANSVNLVGFGTETIEFLNVQPLYAGSCLSIRAFGGNYYIEQS